MCVHFLFMLHKKAGKLILFVKLMLAGLLVWLLWYQLTDKEGAGALATSWHDAVTGNRMPWLAGCILLMPLNWLLEAVKWQKLMSPHLRLSILSAVKTVLSGITAGLVTPARIGEYAGRLVTSDPDHRTEVVSATLLGSISQNLCNIIIGLLFSTYFLRSVFDPGLGGTIIYGTLVMAQAILLVYLYYRLPQVAHRLEKLPGPEFKRKYSDRLKALDLYKPDLLHTVMALSVMRYLVYFVQYVMIVRFLGSPAGFIESARCISGIFLIQTGIPLPAFLSIFARGELAILVWSAVGVNEVVALAATFSIWVINLILPGLAGLYFLLRADVEGNLFGKHK